MNFNTELPSTTEWFLGFTMRRIENVRLRRTYRFLTMIRVGVFAVVAVSVAALLALASVWTPDRHVAA